MQSSNKGYLFLLLVLVLAGLSGYFYTKRPYQYGLDIAGGTRLTYKIVDLKADQKAQLPMIMSNLVKILTDRSGQSLGVVEANVQPKGEDEIIVELPGFTDPVAARQTMSTTASIKLYHSKNVVTKLMGFRPYQTAGRKGEEAGNPYETFMRRNDPTNKVLEPTDPDYKKMIEGWDLILEGTDLSRAAAEVQGQGMVTPQFFFSPEGAKKLDAWSRRYKDQEENLAFVLDGRVLSIAPVQRGALLSDQAIMTGEFSPAYVNGLTKLLNAGALPVTLQETSNQVVDPTIGTFAKDQMIKAGTIAFGVIAIFMIAYYAFPGFVALIALCLYVLFTLTVMKLLNATFSLASIAGFILSVGMAVDANILVFERTKEEMRDGRTLLTAVELGFRRAFPAILDSNACTILTSLVLVVLGTGAVKGFAISLIYGVTISLFTAVTVTRSLLVFMVGSGIVKNTKLFALDRQWFGEGLETNADHKQLQIVNKSGRYFMISLLTIIPGVIFIFLGGIKPNVEFQGGFEATYKLAGAATVPEIVKNMESSGFPGSNAKIVTEAGAKYVSITVPPAKDLRTDDPAAYSKIAAAAKSVEPLSVPSITSIGPSIQAETIENAIKAIIISSVLIVLYLTIRFGLSMGGAKSGFKFGMSAIAALVHDILVVIGVAAIVGKLLHWEVSSLFLTAMLTVIGFSVHDTIVVFDRIRENLHRPNKNEDFEMLCNRSITQSFARSINTSMTVIVTLMILIFMGTSTVDLKFFCLTMLIGILSGTYSSLYNASPILYLWDKAVVRKNGVEHSLINEVSAETARLRALAMQTQVGATAAAPGVTPQAQRGYGQVKRRNSAVDKSKQELDD